MGVACGWLQRLRGLQALRRAHAPLEEFVVKSLTVQPARGV
jgi:hypothetical protein